MAEKAQTPSFSSEINEINRRLRMVEMKIMKIEERLTSLENLARELETDMKIIRDVYDRKIADLKEELSSMNEKIEVMSKSGEQFVNKTEFQKIKLFLDVFNPLKSSFITKEELEAKLEELKKDILRQENKI